VSVLDATPQERLALAVVALLLTAGAAGRVLSAAPEPTGWVNSAGAAADTPSIGSASAVREGVERQLAERRISQTPLAAGERLDPNTATAPELQRLPRVGPALAARIVAHREANGPFRTLADIDAVPGIGPALLAGITPHLALPEGSGAPGTGAVGDGAGPVDVNLASAEELQRLPGVGPVLAERIVRWRRENGPFRSEEELEKVPGIGPRLRERLAPRVRIRR
jgi:competence protein ComEA